MAKNFFRSVYKHPSLTKEDHEEIANAHSRIDLPKGRILLKRVKLLIPIISSRKVYSGHMLPIIYDDPHKLEI